MTSTHGVISRGIVAISFLWSLGSVPSLGQAEELKWKFETGDKLKVTFRQTFEQESVVNFKSSTMVLDMTMVMNWDVVAVDEKGVATIQQKFTRLALNLDSPNGGEVTFDTDAKFNPGEGAKLISEGIGPFMNGSFEVRMNNLGEILSVEIPEKMMQELREAPGSMLLRQMLTQEGLSETLSTSSAILPDRPVSNGETWERTRTLKTPLGALAQTMTYTFEGMTDKGGRALAAIRVESSLALKRTGGTGENQPELGQQEMNGTLFFDIEQGRFAESEIDQTLVTKTPYREMTITTEGKSSVKMTIESRE